MTIRTSDLGGSDWSDGDTLFAADLNDTFGATTLHRKQFSDSTERTTTNTSFVDSGTEFTLSVPVNSIIHGIFLNLEMNISNAAAECQVSVKLNGSTLGDQFVIPANVLATATTGDATLGIYDSSENSDGTFRSINTSYAEHTVPLFIPLKVLDASTTITLRIRTTNGSHTARLRNVVCDVLYTEVFKED